MPEVLCNFIRGLKSTHIDISILSDDVVMLKCKQYHVFMRYFDHDSPYFDITYYPDTDSFSYPRSAIPKEIMQIAARILDQL